MPSRISIQIWGVNAPERCEKGYREGGRALFRLIRRKLIICRPQLGRRRFAWSFQCPVVLCNLVNGLDLGREMIRQSHALACRQCSGSY